jgi:single-stranded-DNA-specific exonuclease
MTDDPAEGTRLAEKLEAYNAERQTIDQRILDDALELVDRDFDLTRDSAFVLAAEGWHPGVVGIVASRVVERFGRPTFLIGFDGEIGKGSGRSISRFNLHDALVECADLLDRFGGTSHGGGSHGAARPAGRVPGAVRRRRRARDSIPPRSVPEQRVDLELPLAEVTDDLERLCRHLEPTGMGNPGPVFGVRGVTFAGRQVVDRDT